MHTTSTIRFPCTICGRVLKTNAQHAGKKCKCNQCHQENIVPELLIEESEPVHILLKKRAEAQPDHQPISYIIATIATLVGFYFLIIYDKTEDGSFSRERSLFALLLAFACFAVSWASTSMRVIKPKG